MTSTKLPEAGTSMKPAEGLSPEFSAPDLRRSADTARYVTDQLSQGGRWAHRAAPANHPRPQARPTLSPPLQRRARSRAALRIATECGPHLNDYP